MTVMATSYHHYVEEHKPLVPCSVPDSSPGYSLVRSSSDMLLKERSKDANNEDVVKASHIFPCVVVSNGLDDDDIDSDEEDFRLRHRKNDSGNGSSISSSLGSQSTDMLQSAEMLQSAGFATTPDNNLDSYLDDLTLRTRTVSSASSYRNSPDRSVKSLPESSFMDVPLNNSSPIDKAPANTFAPSKEQKKLTDDFKPPTITEQPKTKIFSKPANKSWQIFGKVAVPVVNTPPATARFSPSTKPRKETVGSSTTALILEHRPAYLPPKSAKEEQKHRQQYEEMIAAAKRKELKDSQMEQKKLKQRRKLEDQLSNTVKLWKEDIIPNWRQCYETKRVREIWASGVPPSVRGVVWKLAIGNALCLTPDLFDVFREDAEERIRNHRFNDPTPMTNGHSSSLVVSKENTIALIALDVSRTFPALCIFQKGGPYHDPLKSLLAAYTCHRPDIGYVQGMSFLAAMLLLNMDLCDAFIAFTNLLNRPCQTAFFTVDQRMMGAYFRTFDVILCDQLPRLHAHFTQECLSHDIYLLDWIFTIYSKSLPLDTACRVWDMFFRDGEEFLFKTALAILTMHETALLEMEFFRLATYLTKLSSTITQDELFTCLAKINFPSQRYHTTLAQMKTIALTLQPT